MTQVLVDELTTFSQKWHMKILFYYNRKKISRFSYSVLIQNSNLLNLLL